MCVGSGVLIGEVYTRLPSSSGLSHRVFSESPRVPRKPLGARRFAGNVDWLKETAGPKNNPMRTQFMHRDVARTRLAHFFNGESKSYSMPQ